MAMSLDFESLTLTEIIRLQNQLSQVLTRRFERYVAVAFSDIVGSTPYFARWGDEAGRKLQQLHFDLLQQVLPKYEGRIVDTAGDGAFTAFPRVDAATDALIDFQKRVSLENVNRSRDHQLAVRMGIHWGAVLTDGVQVTGDAVNLCSRVTATASGGEIRLTREAFQELSGVGRRLSCRPLPSVPLKGINRTVELMRMEWRDRSLFPIRMKIEETGEEIPLPDQDTVTFGRLKENDGVRANDVVLALPDKALTQQISRWQFELRRQADGLFLRAVSDQITEVDGKAVLKGEQIVIRPGTGVRVARVMTIWFLGEAFASQSRDATIFPTTR